MDARDRILKAATEVFVEKGFAGARTQAIADRAGVNKAMLHYYFRSKEHLYEEVVVSTLTKVMTGIHGAVQDSGLRFEERFDRFVRTYFDSLREHMYMPRLVMQDLMSGGERVADYFRRAAEQAGLLGGAPVMKILEDGMAQGRLRNVDARHALISLVSMIIFFFIAHPVLGAIFQIDLEGEKFDGFLEERKCHIVDLFLHGVLEAGADTSNLRGEHANG